MTRARLIVLAALAGCNQTTFPTPIRSFDRPSDAALTCVQYYPLRTASGARQDGTQGTFNVVPMSLCQPNVASQPTPPEPTDMGVTATFNVPLGPSSFVPFLVAMVTQSARGELAFVDTSQAKLINADPLKPGFGFVPVGKLPEHVRTSVDGCWAVTSNTDSCDFGVVDVNRALTTSQAPVLQTADMGSKRLDLVDSVHRVVAALPNGKIIAARPSWIETAPSYAADPAATYGYTDPGTPGQCTGGVHRLWAAFPGCQLVARVTLPDVNAMSGAAPLTATIDAAIRVTRTGARVVTDLTTIDCPSECAQEGTSGGAGSTPSDLGAPGDMGGLPTTQAYPGTLAVDNVYDRNTGQLVAGRVVIGDFYGERIDLVPFDDAGTLGAPRSVKLEAGAGGVKVVRVSPRSQAGQFLYAIARDGTVRVVDLDREVECETNPDPRYAGGGIDLQESPFLVDGSYDTNWPADPNTLARRLGCFPLGDPATPRRAPNATTPGITFTLGQLPTDVAFVHLEVPPWDPNSTTAPPPASPGLLVGDFAWILTSDGHGTVVDIFDACPQPNQQDVNKTSGPWQTLSCDPANVPLAVTQTVLNFGHPSPLLLDRLSHRVRGGHPRFATPTSASDTAGQPRAIDENNPCIVTSSANAGPTPDGGVAGAGPCLGAANQPNLYAETLPGKWLANGQTAKRVMRFVDPDHARNETWVATWEGLLPDTSRGLGAPISGGLQDPGGQWCAHGVLAGDKLELSGCAVDSDCDQSTVPDGVGAGIVYKCVHDPGAFPDVTQGLCLPVDDKIGHTSDYWIGRCTTLLRSQRKYRIASARQAVKPNDVDTLSLAEIYEPEYAEETHPCNLDADCADVTIVTSRKQVGQTSCLADFDGQRRCLVKCALTDRGVPDDTLCGHDFVCDRNKLDNELRCMRAPLRDEIWFNGQNGCVQEYQPYEIHAGNAFLMAGSTSGVAKYLTSDANGECMVPPQTNEYVRERQSRIPLTPPLTCPDALAANPLLSLDATQPANVCMVAEPRQGMADRIVHFQNAVFNIALLLPKTFDMTPKLIIPPDGTSISVQIIGGGAPLQPPLGVDVQAQQPRAAVVAPDRQTVYIVDEGKSVSAAGLRGQLLRLFSGTETVDRAFTVR